LDVLKSVQRPSQITQISVDDATDFNVSPPKLWFAATIGCGDDEYFRELFKQQIKPVFTPIRTADVRLMIKAGVRPWKHTVDSFPMRLTSAGLSSVRSTASRRFELPTVVVVGESVDDFCLYFALYWQQGRALWLPPWFLPTTDAYPDRLMTAIAEALENGRSEHNESLTLVSYSSSQAELQELKEIISAHMFTSSVSVERVTRHMVASQVEHPARVYADGNIGDVTNHLLFNGSLPGLFESPVPRMLHPVSPLSHRWIADITFMQHLIPRHPALGSISIHGPNVADVRAGRECVSYMCPGFLVISDHMETNILRPSIHVLDADEIFRVILEDSGYESKTSDKGRYQAETVRKFGGLDKAGYALRSDKHRALLMKFLNKSETVKGLYDEGLFIK
jgi:hypothetical protein